MLKVKSNIGDIPVYTVVDGIIYYADGTCFRDSDARNNNQKFYEFEKTDEFLKLNFNNLDLIIDSDEIIFDKEVELCIQYDLKKKELTVLNQNYLDGIRIFLKRIDKISITNFNKINIRKFIFEIIKNEYFYEDFIEKVDISKLTNFYSTFIRLHLSGNIKLLEFLVKFDLTECLSEIFTDNFNANFLYELSELNEGMIIKFCNLLKDDNKSNYLSALLYANNNMNSNELTLLYKFIEICNSLHSYQSWGGKRDVATLINILTDIKIASDNFTTAINTISKELFKNFRFDNVSDVLTEYRDYLVAINQMQELGYTMYPKSINFAHEQAINRLRLYKTEKGITKSVASDKTMKFKNAVNRYKRLAYKNDNYEVIIPNSPLDLAVEGDKLNHCVECYTEYVISGRTNILFCRKSNAIDTPYMTLEIKDGTIYQAKKIGNSKPNIEDQLFLKEYCNSKKLVLVNY